MHGRFEEGKVKVGAGAIAAYDCAPHLQIVGPLSLWWITTIYHEKRANENFEIATVYDPRVCSDNHLSTIPKGRMDR